MLESQDSILRNIRYLLWLIFLLEMNFYLKKSFWYTKPVSLFGIIYKWLCFTSKCGLCSRYYETVSDVLNSVKKMEESLKRLKQARKTTPANPVGSSGSGMSDDDKIRLQLALDVEYLGEQVTPELFTVPVSLKLHSEGSAVSWWLT